MGLNSAMLHAHALSVSEGMTVRQGQPIGEVGMTGRATGPHLHWSLAWHGRRLDPLLFLATAVSGVAGPEQKSAARFGRAALACVG
jgi:murein DD-endopeptidase MepM/ murein hydrolase activator NlpD